MMGMEGEKKKEEAKKKRGRKTKNFKDEYVLNKDQEKFFVDFSRDKKTLEKVFSLLEQANKKDYGREIIFKDLVVYALRKIGEKDLVKIQEMGLSDMDKVKRLFDEHQKKTGDDIELGEFLAKKLGIN